MTTHIQPNGIASNGLSNGVGTVSINTNGHSNRTVAAPATTKGHSNGTTNGHSNGTINRHINGTTNGYSNGTTNGYSNGTTNVHSNGATASTKNSSLPPIAIVGMACRLPGHVHTPKSLWDLMSRNGVASNTPPQSRFRLPGHFDKSQKPYTMKTPGAMFLEDVDPADFDAQFFNINHMDASSMDPQQKNLMEVAYECLENAGIPVESLGGKRVGCLVGASAVGESFFLQIPNMLSLKYYTNI